MLYGHTYATWIVFHAILFGLLALDLGIFNRKAHIVHMREALLWSAFWISIGIGYGGYVWFHDGQASGVQYLTGFVVEKSLSVDNLFVFLVIFRAFQIPRLHQHRLLFWGILGAIVLRAGMIALGTALLDRFHFLIYIFGAFLIFTGYKIFRGGTENMNPRGSATFRLLKRFLPLSEAPYQGHLIVREHGRRVFSIGFAALMLIESSDVIFALDSVPAVFGITRDPYLVYTSNIFAILGLRSLYFVLEDMMDKFHLLKYGLALILALVGTKMCLESVLPISPGLSLAIILTILATSILLSIKIKPRKHSGK